MVPRTEEMLASNGRMKFLKPLYTALAKDDRTRPVARALYDRTRASYHPIARQGIESVLREAGA